MESFSEHRSSFALFNTSAASGLLVESARGLKAFSPAFAPRRRLCPRSCANSPADAGKPGLVASPPALLYDMDRRASEPRNSLSGGDIPESWSSARYLGIFARWLQNVVKLSVISAITPGRACGLLESYWRSGDLRSRERSAAGKPKGYLGRRGNTRRR
jgi:hypothetical protein